MRYRKYGAGGPEVSVLGFGAMRLPGRRKGNWGSVNFSKSTAVIRAALERGVNFIDSHHQYHDGLSEEAIGRALRGWKGHRVYIQTKTPFYREEPLAYFKKLIEKALEKTGADCIDYLLFHSMEAAAFGKRGGQFFKLTDWAMKHGYIKHRGFSSHDSPANVKKFIDTGEFAAMLVSYNWLNPQMAEVIAYGADKGMGVAVMNPVGGGSLAVDTVQIRRLLPAAKSASELALRYVMSTQGVSVVLSGMSTLEQVEENTAVASLRSFMTERQGETMHARLAGIRRKAEQFCTACGYCMPCPAGVDIPGNFVLRNQAHYFGLLENSRKRFEGLQARAQGDASALACERCGECLPKCPNGIAIMDQLSETAELLGE